jgi:hypothetical protein
MIGVGTKVGGVCIFTMFGTAVAVGSVTSGEGARVGGSDVERGGKGGGMDPPVFGVEWLPEARGEGGARDGRPEGGIEFSN